MADKLVDEVYKYYSTLKNREPTGEFHIVYEDEYDQLKKLYIEASEAVAKIPGPYTRSLKEEIDSLCDILDYADCFLYELNNSRKTD